MNRSCSRRTTARRSSVRTSVLESIITTKSNRVPARNQPGRAWALFLLASRIATDGRFDAGTKTRHRTNTQTGSRHNWITLSTYFLYIFFSISLFLFLFLFFSLLFSSFVLFAFFLVSLRGVTNEDRNKLFRRGVSTLAIFYFDTLPLLSFWILLFRNDVETFFHNFREGVNLKKILPRVSFFFFARLLSIVRR